MPEKTIPVRTGLQNLRKAAPTPALLGTLAQEPPATFQEESPLKGEHPNRQVSTERHDQMLREWVAGAPLSEVEDRYGVSRGYLRQASMRRFGSKEALLQALQNLIAENAVVAQMVAQEKLHELNAAQAVFAGKLLTETYIALDKHIESKPKTINFGELNRLGTAIRDLKTLVTRQPPSEQAPA